MEINSLNPVRENKSRPEPVAKNSNKERAKGQEISSGQQKNSKISRSELVAAVDNSNEIGQLLNRKLNFDIDESTDKIVVKVIDEESGDVVRQLPPQEMLKIAAHLKKLKDMNEQVMWAVKSVILDVSA